MDLENISKGIARGDLPAEAAEVNRHRETTAPYQVSELTWTYHQAEILYLARSHTG